MAVVLIDFSDNGPKPLPVPRLPRQYFTSMVHAPLNGLSVTTKSIFILELLFHYVFFTHTIRTFLAIIQEQKKQAN
ncbi:hypothetical protein P167DRAFT_380580 [Morchella conica CCBAS932]|uniref:Uncharacterized protein n=1 Tax=Morchella conica CCBAS932 TaxID=1392247 RepID=A0A3N4L2A9_9PEZI|nr:hypothetical protein P167DRAFT_380580 [Morchella conica CCBAS932]